VSRSETLRLLETELTKTRDRVTHQADDVLRYLAEDTMKPHLKSALAHDQPAVASTAVQLMSTALLAFFAATASAVAQVPSTYVPATQWGLNLIGAPVAWALNYTGNGITVAVGDTGIDTGFGSEHPAFSIGAVFGAKIDSRSMNFVLPSPGAQYLSDQIADLDTHGTHVSGIIAASGSSNAPGVAYSANIVMLRVLAASQSCQPENVNCSAPNYPNATASSLDYFSTLQTVRIYNASYGPIVPQGKTNLLQWPVDMIDPVEEKAALNAVSQGKIIVAAAGNDRENNPVAGKNPSGLGLDPFIRPGINANAGVYVDEGRNYDFSSLLNQTGLIIVVTSVDKNKNVVSYAQECGVTASWCVAAPGGNGKNYIADSNGDNVPLYTDSNGIYSAIPYSIMDTQVQGYGFMSGTSMAAPVVSGALAVLSGAYTNYDSQDLAHVLFATAENVGGQAADNATYGYGMIRLDRAIAGPTTLAAGSPVEVDDQKMIYWSQPLSTDGAFSKSGAGYLIIAGRTTANGGVTVSEGALGVDGTLTLDAGIIVAKDAALAGFGTINGDTEIDGVLNAGQLPNYSDLNAYYGGVLPPNIPLTGTSPGTLTFNGNVTLGTTANTRVNVDGNLDIPGGPGTYDKIIVEGASHTFAANGALSPILRSIPGGYNDYVPAIGSSFSFLTASNGASITGSFASLSQPAEGLPINARFDLVYAPTIISLDVTPQSYLALAAIVPLNANQQALAAALDRARPAAGPALSGAQATIFYALYGQQDISGDASALSAISGQGQAVAPGALLDAYTDFSNVIANRQAMLLAGLGDVQAALTPSIALSYASGTGPNFQALADAGGPFAVSSPGGAAPRSPWTTWGQAYGRASRVGDLNGLPGSDASSGGFAVGGDGAFAPNLVAGGALGYTHSSANSANTTATGNTYAGALYATWTPGLLVFDGRLAAGPSTGGASRGITFPSESMTASSSMNVWGGLAAADAGYRFDLMEATFKPFVGLTAQTFSRSAFTETSDFGLTFPSQSFNRVTSEVGLWATKLFRSEATTYMLQAKASWTNDFGNQGLTTQAALLDQPFTITAANPGRSAAVIAVNFAAWRTENVALFFQYQGEFRSNATSNQGSIGVRMIW
jgi:subtilase-type serine protease